MVVIIALITASCVDLKDASDPPAPGTDQRTVYVVGHGWHTGIVMPSADIPKGLWPEKEHFSGAAYLEVGWGEETFYRAQEVTVPMILKAALFPTRSVLHVVGFDEPVGAYFPNSRVIQLGITRSGFLALIHYVRDEFVPQEGGAAAPIGKGLYGNSYFFRARGTYSLFHNCNYWVAYGLSVAGVSMSPYSALTAGAVLTQASRAADLLERETESRSP